MSAPFDPRVPTNSIVFGYGPMLPLIVAGIGVWALPDPWPGLAVRLAIIWGAMILIFVAGVRRGFGFGLRLASTAVEIATMLVYFIPAGLALVSPVALWSLLLLLVGFACVVVLDPLAARRGDAPAHFARLRPPQMTLALAALASLAIRVG